jgi:hypothetical protein
MLFVLLMKWIFATNCEGKTLEAFASLMKERIAAQNLGN